MMPTRYSVDISFDKTNINKELMKVRHNSCVATMSVQQTCKGADVGGGHLCVAAAGVEDSFTMQDRYYSAINTSCLSRPSSMVGT